MSTILYQFHLSHYCEKIRWALELKDVRYRKVSFIPGLHRSRLLKISGQGSVPVLRHGDDIVSGSAAILEYLDREYPDHPLIARDPDLRRQTLNWEKRLDAVGIEIRVWAYHHLLADRRLMLPLLTSGKGFFKRLFVALNYHRFEQQMRRYMKINDKTAAQAQRRIEHMLGELRDRYARSHFLVGEHFSRADLTACALFAMLFQPAEYPVPWPAREALPQAMRNWLDRNDALLEPLRIRYAQYR